MSQTKAETFFDLATHVTEGRTGRRKDGRREVIDFVSYLKVHASEQEKMMKKKTTTLQYNKFSDRSMEV